MQIDDEGHILTSPRDVCERLNQPGRLINDVFIPGTPVAFPTYARYCDFLAHCADGFGVHSRNLLVRGSTKLGFSISPDADSAWVEMRPESDLDLAIIDPDYYHFLDREIRMWERNPENEAFSGPQFSKSIARQKQRGFYTYRYFAKSHLLLAIGVALKVAATPRRPLLMAVRGQVQAIGLDPFGSSNGSVPQ